MSVRRVVIRGRGSAAARHLRVLEAMPGIEAVGVSGAESWRSADAGIVATDTGRHVDCAIQALDRSLDVLVEKPLAATAVQAATLRDHAQRMGRRLHVASPLRFSSGLQRFRDALGRLGRVHAVRVECRSYLPDWRPDRPYRDSYSARPAEGGVLRDLIHDIDYAAWLFGWPSAVHGRLGRHGILGIAADEQAELSWETPAGALLSLSLDYLSRPPRRRLTAFGAEGTLDWNALTGEFTRVLVDQPPATEGYAESLDDLFSRQDAAFLNADSTWLATAEDGVRALAVCDAARLSAHTRREEPVDYPI